MRAEFCRRKFRKFSAALVLGKREKLALVRDSMLRQTLSEATFHASPSSEFTEFRVSGVATSYEQTALARRLTRREAVLRPPPGTSRRCVQNYRIWCKPDVTMAPSAVPVDGFPTAHDEAEVLRPLKRTKTELTHSTTESQLGEDGPDAIPPHPLGVKPLGNAYTTRRNLKASAGSFKRLPDELLVHFLEYLEAVDLLKLGGTCKALYAFTRFEDLWKTLFVE